MSDFFIDHVMLNLPPESISFVKDGVAAPLTTIRSEGVSWLRDGGGDIQLAITTLFAANIFKGETGNYQSINECLIPLLRVLRTYPIATIESDYLAPHIGRVSFWFIRDISLLAVGGSVPPGCVKARFVFDAFNIRPLNTTPFFLKEGVDESEVVEAEHAATTATVNEIEHRVQNDGIVDFGHWYRALASNKDDNITSRLRESRPWMSYVERLLRGTTFLSGEMKNGLSIFPYTLQASVEDAPTDTEKASSKTILLGDDFDGNPLYKVESLSLFQQDGGGQAVPSGSKGVVTGLTYNMHVPSVPLRVLSQPTPTRQFMGGVQESISVSIEGVGPQGEGALIILDKELADTQEIMLRYPTFANGLGVRISSDFISSVLGVNEVIFKSSSIVKENVGSIGYEFVFFPKRMTPAVLPQLTKSEDSPIFSCYAAILKYVKSRYVGDPLIRPTDPGAGSLSWAVNRKAIPTDIGEQEKSFLYKVLALVAEKASEGVNYRKEYYDFNSLFGLKPRVRKIDVLKLWKKGGDSEKAQEKLEEQANKYEEYMAQTLGGGEFSDSTSVISPDELADLQTAWQAVTMGSTRRGLMAAAEYIDLTPEDSLEGAYTSLCTEQLAGLLDIPAYKEILQQYNYVAAPLMAGNYTDLRLPVNPITGRALDTDPDFFWAISKAEQQTNINWGEVAGLAKETLSGLQTQATTPTGTGGGGVTGGKDSSSEYPETFEELQSELNAGAEDSSSASGSSSGPRPLVAEMSSNAAPPGWDDYKIAEPIIHYGFNTGTGTPSGSAEGVLGPDTTLKMMDAVSRNYGINKAFPTYKLFFIEEDMFGNNSNHWQYALSSDDFYQWAEVRSFSLYEDKDLAHSVLRLELLDNNGFLSGRIPVPAGSEADDLLSTDPDGEEVNVVGGFLRDGMKIVLRFGYGANPYLLPTRFVGSVVASQHSGPLVNIVAHSYGAELNNDILQGGAEVPPDIDATGRTNRTAQKVAIYTLSEEWVPDSNMKGTRLLHFGHIAGLGPNSSKSPGVNNPVNPLFLQKLLSSKNTRIENLFLPLYDLEEETDGGKFSFYGYRPWDVFRDLSRRYPGHYPYVLPYEDEYGYRNTLFMGRGDSPYVYRSATPWELAWEKKKISTMDTQTGETTIRTTGGRAKELILDIGSAWWWAANHMPLPGTINPFYFEANSIDSPLPFALADHPFARVPGMGTYKTQAAKQFKNRIRSAYGIALDRMRPFRQYFSATSDTNILYNNIEVQSDHIPNAVNVKWNKKYSTTSVGVPSAEVAQVKADDTIESLRWATTYEQNAYTSEMAFLYGVGNLEHALKDIYTGSLGIIGEPQIKPYDIVVVEDQHTKITGPIEVKAVEHIFSSTNGFVSRIEPDLITASFDQTTYAITAAATEAIVGLNHARRLLTENELSIFQTQQTGTSLAMRDYFGEDMSLVSFNPYVVPWMVAKASMYALSVAFIWLWNVTSSAKRDPIIVFPLMKGSSPYIAGLDHMRREGWLTNKNGKVEQVKRDIIGQAVPRTVEERTAMWKRVLPLIKQPWKVW